jgi:hypothetical protein
MRRGFSWRKTGTNKTAWKGILMAQSGAQKCPFFREFGCAMSTFFTAHSWRKTICAVIRGGLELKHGARARAMMLLLMAQHHVARAML